MGKKLIDNILQEKEVQSLLSEINQLKAKISNASSSEDLQITGAFLENDKLKYRLNILKRVRISATNFLIVQY